MIETTTAAPQPENDAPDARGDNRPMSYSTPEAQTERSVDARFGDSGEPGTASPPTDNPATPRTAPAAPASLRRLTGRAIGDYAMIREGDRVLVGLSGGKDSLSLLWCLRTLAERAPIRFEVGAVTIDPEIEGFDPSRLKAYLAAFGIDYHFVSEPIAALAEQHMERDSFCSFCSRMKRGLMYRSAREHGYNVLALGQHLDDLAESFLMSAFHGGRLNTMKAHYTIDAGDLRVIRPFVYVRERQTRAFADAATLPVIADNCPACFSKPTAREHMKQLLAREEQTTPRLFKNLLAAMRPLLDGHATVAPRTTPP